MTHPKVIKKSKAVLMAKEILSPSVITENCDLFAKNMEIRLYYINKKKQSS